MMESSELLNLPGFFLCEKSQCILRVAICIKRQMMSNRRFKDSDGAFAICFNCEQGERNMRVYNEADIPFVMPKSQDYTWTAHKQGGMA
ncbi:MAG: hypothetical protein R6U50_10505 [Desulfobacterales bacterium]